MKVTTDRQYTWDYEDGVYYKSDTNGPVSQLSVSNIPDPFQLWKGKTSMSEQVLLRPLTEDERLSLKPAEYLFDLWAHKESL